jgi:hypothetical protein
MDNEGNLLSRQDKKELGVKPEQQFSGNDSQNESHIQPQEKASSKDAKSELAIKAQLWIAIVQVAGAIITAIATMIVALLAFQPLINWLQPSLTPAFTPTSAQTPIFVDTATPIFTSTPYPVNLPSISVTSTATVTVTDTPTIQASPAPILIPRLVANNTSGRSPLIVKFDARDSFLRESNGIQFSCQAGTCYYTWRVYSNGQQIGRSANNSSGKFEYTFRQRGSYSVTVYICRGQDRTDCGDTGTLIEVTR